MFNSKMIGTNNAGAVGGPLTIGDYVGGGIVFYVNPDNDAEGLVVALDRGFGRRIYTGSVTAATTTAIGYARYNTDNLIAAHGTGYSPDWCRSYNGGGFNDWSMASRDDLNAIYDNYSTINSSLSSNGGTYTIGTGDYGVSSSVVNTANMWGGSVNQRNVSVGTYNTDLYYYPVRSYSPFDQLVIGDNVEEGIVMYTEFTWGTGGYVISIDEILNAPVAYNVGYFSANTPGGIKDAALATDQIISEFSGSTSFPAGACRAYKDGKWDFGSRSVLNQFKNNVTLINNAIVAAGGTAVPSATHNGSDIYLQYSAWGYTNPHTGSGSLHTGAGRIRATKYVGTWEIFRS
jgi:hypothetical protein